MASFKDFISTFSSDSGEKGKQFERFVKWFLLNDPTWKTQVEQVWHWDEYPNRWGKDLGIDLVFQHKNGDLWAVQAKCYAETTSITKAHVDSFISESDSKTFAGRLLIGTTDSLADNAKKVCDRQNVTRFLLADFESSASEYPDHYEELLRAAPPKPPEPRKHQLEAIRAVQEGFRDTDRGQLIMACGTGKTFTTLWIKEALEAESTLILLPSLGLLSQTLHEWTKAASKPFEVLCVCSDDSVGKKNDDESYESVAQLPFPVTSDPQRIQAFLELQKPKVVFSTYQSSPLVAEAQAATTGIEFDFIVADEAHRCAGVMGDGFSSVLNSQRLRGNKRLFATATPRIYSKQTQSAAEGRGIEVVGMDDESVFGRPLYTLSFGEAIRRRLLSDYRVVIVGVDDAMLASWIENREIVRTATGIQTDAKSLAAAVGLLKAIKDYGIYRLISFHSRVDSAETFAKEIHGIQEWLPKEARLTGKLNSDYVSGAMSTDKRRQKLRVLANLADGDVSLLSNARCLSEGVDIPSLDGVAFIDPKKSQIDILQAVGRAIRLSDKKTSGTIVLPIFLEKGDNPDDVIERSDFKWIWEVLIALKAHDEILADELSQLRIGMGENEKNYFVEDLSKVIFDLPVTLDPSLAQAIKTKLVVETSPRVPWDEWWRRLLEYVLKYRDALVPRKFKTADDFALGQWVSQQRKERQSLPEEKQKRLEILRGWEWEPLEAAWQRSFEALKAYSLLNGDVRVPARFKNADGINLGVWVRAQWLRRESLPNEKKILLEQLNGWQWGWDEYDEDWDLGFTTLQFYVLKNGNPLVPRHFKTDDGLFLGRWVFIQKKRRHLLSLSRQARLDAIPGWVWSFKYD
ncbi:Helicase associated domain protein [Burkholderiaceae bacterium]|nr:Helicase associated domain protein [Burkholderiaceae bacterium]